MMRPSRLAVVGSITLLLVGCKLLNRDKSKTKDDEVAVVSGTAEKVPSTLPGTSEKAAAAEKGCALPTDGMIKADVTVAKGCTVPVTKNLRIRDNATLTVEAGVKLVMDADRNITVDKGKLVVQGTEKEPVVFTSAAATPAPGDWSGIIFEDGVSAGTVLDHARLEYAGSPRSGNKGALWIQTQRSPDRISITHVTIENCEQAAVFSDSDKAGFAKFENNHMKNNKVSVKVPAVVLGSIGAGNTFADPLATWGEVEETTTWPAFDAPVVVERNISVGGRGSAAVLTIQPKTVLRFAGGRYLSVGDRNGGSLTARDVTFTSANATPQPGDWAGIFLAARATNVDLSGATLEFAGKGSGARAGLTLRAPAKALPGLKATGTTYRQNVGAGVSTEDGDCAAFESGKSEPAPLCKKR